MLIKMFACLVQIISRLDIQSKFEMFTPSICRLRCWCKLEVHQHGGSIPILGCVNLCKIFWQISEACENAQHVDLKLAKVSSLVLN